MGVARPSERVPLRRGLEATLERYGVEYTFGMKILEESDYTVTRPICIHHEAAAALMAYGYARVSGKPGVVALNKPGTANALMGLHEAWQSSVALVVLVDGMQPHLIGKHALYEHDTAGVVRVFTKAIVDAWSHETYPEQLRKAFRIATTGRPGPVAFHARAGGTRAVGPDAQVDVWAEPEFTRFPAHRRPPDPDAIRAAATALRSAERAVIIAGGGVNLARAWDELRELAELTQLPVATTISGKGAFDERHPLSVGALGDVQAGRYGRGRVAARVVEEADLVLLVGSRTNQMATSSWTLPSPASTLIHVDVDEENIGRNYRTDVAVVGDARLALRALIDGIRGYEAREARAPTIRRLLDEWAEDSSAFLTSDQVPIHPGRLLGEVSRLVDENTIVVSDGSSPFMWATSHLLVSAGPTFISPRGTGAIGTGLPMALGAKLAAPSRDVICFEGDGGIMCGILAELETAARCAIGVTTVVFNNATLGHERYNMQGGQEYMDFLPGIDFALVARGLKCEGIRVERPDEIRPALERGRTNGRAGRPTLVDVVIHPAQFLRAPFGFGAGR